MYFSMPDLILILLSNVQRISSGLGKHYDLDCFRHLV